VKYPLV
jgi:hypothetical protein